MDTSQKLQSIIFSFIVSFFLLCSTTVVHAQIGNVQPLLQADDDASLLVQGYLSPLSSGLGANLNSGWNSSAGARRPFGFSIQIRGAVATVPVADQSFTISGNDYNVIQPSAGTEVSSPTISGENETGPLVESKQTLPNGEPLFSFNTPQGLGVSYVPTPMIQASVGLPKNFEVTGRIIPETPLRIPVVGKEDFGTFRMFGVGAKHDINGYIPGGNMFPVKLSLMAGFNQIELSSDLNLQPDIYGNAEEDPDYTGNYDNQEVAANINSFTVNVIAGKDLPIISVYGGVGYETSTMDLGINGDFPIVEPNPDYPQNSNNPKRIRTETDPVSFSQNGANNFHALVGGSVSLLFFDFVVEATLGNYSVVNAGIGLGF